MKISFPVKSNRHVAPRYKWWVNYVETHLDSTNFHLVCDSSDQFPLRSGSSHEEVPRRRFECTGWDVKQRVLQICPFRLCPDSPWCTLRRTPCFSGTTKVVSGPPDFSPRSPALIPTPHHLLSLVPFPPNSAGLVSGPWQPIRDHNNCSLKILCELPWFSEVYNHLFSHRLCCLVRMWHLDGVTVLGVDMVRSP